MVSSQNLQLGWVKGTKTPDLYLSLLLSMLEPTGQSEYPGKSLTTMTTAPYNLALNFHFQFHFRATIPPTQQLVTAPACSCLWAFIRSHHLRVSAIQGPYMHSLFPPIRPREVDGTIPTREMRKQAQRASHDYQSGKKTDLGLGPRQFQSLRPLCWLFPSV